MFLLEYTPDKEAKALHIFSWVASIFGIFFVLAGHQHYTIDCVMAVTISHRLFVHYHLSTLSGHSDLGEKWVGLAFPMFSWMESDSEGAVYHTYEWPWQAKWRPLNASSVKEKY